MDHYAWAPITVADKVTKGAFVTIPVGEKVSRSQIGEADWKPLVAAGVIRRSKYPKDVKVGESPRTAMLRKANEAMEKAKAAFDYNDDEDDDYDEHIS